MCQLCSSNNSPCIAGISLKTGAKLMALILIMKDFFGLALQAGTILKDWDKAWDQYTNLDDDDNDKGITLWFLYYGGGFLVTVLDVGMAVTLYRGASKGLVSSCRHWCWYGAVVLICCTAILIDSLLTDMNATVLWMGTVCFVLYGYTLLISGGLKDDLKAEKEDAARIQFEQRMEGYLDGNVVMSSEAGRGLLGGYVNPV
ncbi:uncharacterized protein LOC110853664 [Folsomia candida]|uniref:Transcription elongation factor SPT4 n=1 Tax=Folsomia candida TaxID=158441 RepID=A0A226E1G7_FOLCA|nr:uncharacterized protein LOC110853664 [Folsomia candida]OXA51128.1 Transcription elongation factor SPT4 [Folsomia candida]